MERSMAWFVIEVLQEEKRKAGKMIAVQVTQKNNVEPQRIETGAFHRQQSCWTAVEKKEAIRGFDQVGALISTAAAKGVAATQNA
jgi:hypothetical protein